MLNEIEENESFKCVFELLPEKIRYELLKMATTRKNLFGGISELRIRRGRASSVIFKSERLGLFSELGDGELNDCLFRLSGGSLYACRESLANGYISLPMGVRVGVCGSAGYEGGKLIGVSGISSLVFRIPTCYSDFESELHSAFSSAECGMLVYSPPGGGKTTALRSLVSRISSGRDGLNVAVIDERCEFFRDNYINCRVDILRGYKKNEGLEIALRTLSPDVIVVDEIGSREEAESMLPFLNSGVKLAASAHAADFSELMVKSSLKDFFSHSVFDCFFGIKAICGKRSYELKLIDREKENVPC